MFEQICYRQEELEGQMTERQHQSERRRIQDEEEEKKAREDEEDYEKVVQEEVSRMRELGFVPKVMLV